ncbi:MAG: efflux RND transporter periplasmic adaptor subunit [Thermoflexales bacterium]|nr:efflux RND transporter periplasmic adaptor subunit [Thermoflexales bacterium]
MKRIIPIIVILAAIGGGWWWTQRSNPAESGLVASGTIEARQVRLAAEVGGRIVELSAQEGEAVQAGQVLLRLDDSLLLAQRAQAEAVVAAARAQRDVLAAGARVEQVSAARATISTTQAALAGAQAAQAGARAAMSGTQAALAGAQADLNRLLDGATYADVAAAQAALAQSQAQLKSAQAAQRQANEQHDKTMECHSITKPDGSKTEFCPTLGTLEELARYNLNAADEALSAAAVGEKAAQARLNKLYSGATTNEIDAAQARVAAAQAQVDQAQAHIDQVQAQGDQAQAQVEAARAQYDLLLAGASEEQLAAADATVAQAEAALGVLEAQAGKLLVRAPLDGVVIARNVEPGEILSPGAAAYVLGSLDELELVVYLPEDRYGRVKVGQVAQVTVDSHPGESFPATVVHIADQAEFTPRNVQTAEGRRVMVFAVRLSVPNSKGMLKPGMPADVVFK